MQYTQVALSLLGGGLIGLAVTILLLFNGRVTGISGIISSSLAKPTSDGVWRIFFLLGLILGGFVVQVYRPEFFSNTTDRGFVHILIAGLLVGYGTVMGSGCTSGHGVCGMSRFSMRSLIATFTFILFAFLTVMALRLFGGFTR